MASPQTEEGHIDIANTIADKFCSYRLSGQEWQVVWVVLRKTWGWLENPKDKNGVKKKMDRIAMSQFSELTGIDRRKCHDILKRLVKKNVLKKTVTQKGGRTTISYGFQKDFDLWEVSPKKVTVPNIGGRVSPKKGAGLSPKKAHTKEKKETIKDTPEIFNFVDQLIDYMIETKKNKAPKKTPSLISSSIDTVEKLIRIDGFDLGYIKSVCRWAVKDDFYSSNFFSLSPLRTKSKNGVTKFVNMSVKFDKANGNWSVNNSGPVDPDAEQRKFEELLK